LGDDNVLKFFQIYFWFILAGFFFFFQEASRVSVDSGLGILISPVSSVVEKYRDGDIIPVRAQMEIF
jgi:hypothetical protein